jgi:RES domain-containing protein
MARQGRGRILGGVDPKREEIDEEFWRFTAPKTVATDLRSICPVGSRYSEPRTAQPWYGSREKLVALKEIERHASAPIADARLTLAHIKATVIDAYSPSGLSALRLTRHDLTLADNRACLELARLAREIGAPGLLVPSAAVPAEANIVIWRDDVGLAVRVIRWTILRYPGAE